MLTPVSIDFVKFLLAALVVAGALRSAQTDQPFGTSPSAWTGQRIIRLHGFGQIHHTDGDRDVHDALLLSDAIAYFTAKIERNPRD